MAFEESKDPPIKTQTAVVSKNDDNKQDLKILAITWNMGQKNQTAFSKDPTKFFSDNVQ